LENGVGRAARGLDFPHLPQGRAKGLCKADCLCEKHVQGAMKSGLEEMPFSTEGEDYTNRLGMEKEELMAH
jgi:hypothetical protein